MILRELGTLDEGAFKKGLSHWNREDWTWFTFEYKEGMTHSEHLQALADARDPNKIAPGRVPATMLYAFIDGEIVGRVSIRHELNDFLLQRGGHIGYAVNEIYRKKGYGQEILAGAIEFCRKQLGLDRVLITCSAKNTPSVRMIEKAGGVLENVVHDPDTGDEVNRYWVSLA
ncbi:GNAT family N-acetyltransferase [Bacteriovorax sp. Seq25_V]|uniref:GNAT family N-acetyltransferase n=1 Tax=Bacteriovorax sp. Seq25_V TaxID=1201288 RepID=UPI00038A29C9|nr:GNAT family N-acetyltransferase [Bacteriovorax sp. Seq25_V]EQC45597.1 acetyltransferase, GNAT family [Bacteriovorax sp. Seq25_V]